MQPFLKAFAALAPVPLKIPGIKRIVTGQILRTELIQKEDTARQTEVENFLKLKEEDFSNTIFKIAFESQQQRQRQKKVILPSMEDIKTFSIYLKDKRKKSFEYLEKDEFSLQVWKTLSETTLLSILLFNRKRPGELERILITDLENCEGLSKSDCNNGESLAKYKRLMIRGKKGRNVPVLLSEELLQSINLIIKYRNRAGVVNNPYVFGTAGLDKRRHCHLRATVLMRKYSNLSGAKEPSLLRGTVLRKHVATTCMSLELGDNEVDALANFMGHHERIHKTHYRQSVISRDLAVSKFLEYAIGLEENDAKCDSDKDTDSSDNNQNINYDNQNDKETNQTEEEEPKKNLRKRKYKSTSEMLVKNSQNEDDSNENDDSEEEDNDTDEDYNNSKGKKKRASTCKF